MDQINAIKIDPRLHVKVNLCKLKIIVNISRLRRLQIKEAFMNIDIFIDLLMCLARSIVALIL